MPPRPFAPLPKLADVNRRERSWVLMAGHRQFSLTRIDHSASFSTNHRIQAQASNAWRPTTIIGTMLALIGGATLLGLAINSSRAAAGYRYVVSVPVPPLRGPTTHTVVVKPVRVRRAVTMSATTEPAAAVPAASPAVPAYTIGDLDTIEATTSATTMSAAVQAAMRTGHLQQWSAPDGSERGFVVAGPAEANTGGCRSLSILTRRDGENQVASRRECLGTLEDVGRK